MPSATRQSDSHIMESEKMSNKKNTYRGIFKKITRWSGERDEAPKEDQYLIEKDTDYRPSTSPPRYYAAYFGPMSNYDELQSPQYATLSTSSDDGSAPSSPRRRKPSSYNWSLSASEVQQLPPIPFTPPKTPLPAPPPRKPTPAHLIPRRPATTESSPKSKVQWEDELQKQIQRMDLAQEADPPQFDPALSPPDRKIKNFVTGQKPAIVIVPGSFAGICLYESVIRSLQNHGYAVRFADLPSIVSKSLPIQKRPPPATLEDDSKFISRMISSLADEGRDILLVGHSYGGLPMTESCKHQSKLERTTQGRPGGVIGMVFITAFVPSIGESMRDMLAAIARPPEDRTNNVELDGGVFLSLNAELSAPMTFGELSHEEGVKQIKRMGIQSLNSFGGLITSEAWRELPVSYVYCKNDRVNPIGMQESMVEKVEKETGRKVRVYECDTGHCPNITNPEKVVGIIRRAAGENLTEE